MNMPFRFKGWTILLGLTLLMALALIAVACGEEEEEGEIKDIERSPDTPIVIPADEPLIIGVSTALTGPIGPRGSQYRDAVVVGVERWKAANGDQIAGHDIEVHGEDDGCAESHSTCDDAEHDAQVADDDHEKPELVAPGLGEVLVGRI